MRRGGHSAGNAADLAQDYFTRLIQGGLLRAANRDKGRFRSFLQADCRFFLADMRDRDQAQKRGGGVQWVTIDSERAEARLGLEPSDGMDPDRLFDRAWAISLLDRAFDQLADDEVRAGRAVAFSHLKVFLTDGSRVTPYAPIAEALGTTVIAVQSAVARLRRRYGAILRAEVAATLADPDKAEIDEEIGALYSALAR